MTAKKLTNETLSTPQVTTYTYDPVSSLKTVMQPNGVRTTYKYDINRLYEDDVDRGAGATATHIQKVANHLRADGLRDSETDKVYNAAARASAPQE